MYDEAALEGGTSSGLSTTTLWEDCKAYINEICSHPCFEEDEEQRIFRQYRLTNSAELRERIVKANTRLVVKIAKNYVGKSPDLSLVDLVHEGILGLYTAIEWYDSEASNKFGTYAWWWISQNIIEAIREKGNSIPIPSKVISLGNKETAFVNAYINEHGRNPSDNEIANALDISCFELQKNRNYRRNIISFDDPSQTSSLPPSPNNPIVNAEEVDMREQVLSALNQLPPEERSYIYNRYNFNCKPINPRVLRAGNAIKNYISTFRRSNQRRPTDQEIIDHFPKLTARLLSYILKEMKNVGTIRGSVLVGKELSLDWKRYEHKESKILEKLREILMEKLDPTDLPESLFHCTPIREELASSAALFQKSLFDE